MLNDLKLFLANTSIRGFSRIIRTEFHVVRILWILFIVTNSIILCISIQKVVKDYCRYSVNVQTYTVFDNATKFPAVTFCNNQPFSLDAYRFWNNKQVMSPTQFNRKLRKIALNHLEKFKSKLSEEHMEMTTFWLAGVDRIGMYYQSLEPDWAFKLGHNQSMFYNCIFWYRGTMAIDETCNDKLLRVTKISHPSYFNCYTVEPRESISKDVVRIGMIIWLGPEENVDKKHKQGLLFDIFEQAYGLRVTMHEPNSYPNIENIGMQIEPGRMNEINFYPILNTRVNSPARRCVYNITETYPDLGNIYRYDRSLCVKHHLQQQVLNRCQCYFSRYPRPFTPNSSYPYCGHINFSNISDFNQRGICTKTYIESSSRYKKYLEENVCFLRCRDMDYKLTISVTKWRPTDWQLYWIKEVMQAYNKYQENILLYNDTKNKHEMHRIHKNMNKELKILTEYLTRANLTTRLKQTQGMYNNLMSGDRFSFVVIKRRDNSTLVKEERFVLTASALISRIGGLCSLYMGLTFAFFVELIEQLYMLIYNSIAPNKAGRSRSESRDMPQIIDCRSKIKANVTYVDNIDNDDDDDDNDSNDNGNGAGNINNDNDHNKNKIIDLIYKQYPDDNYFCKSCKQSLKTRERKRKKNNTDNDEVWVYADDK